MDASGLIKLFCLLVFCVVGCQQPPTPDLTPTTATPAPSPSPVRISKSVGLFKSPATFEALGWKARWEWSGAEATLKRLSVDYEVVEPDQLASWNGTLLVLPNVRNMSAETVELIGQRDIKLLATYMTSYRQADNSSWSPNNFALAGRLGIDFDSWVGSGERADTLVIDQREIPLGRQMAMLVKPRPEAKVLGRWKGGEPAIVQGPAGIYVGEDLFCPENSDSLEVTELLAELLNRLQPGCAVVPEQRERGPEPQPPYVELPESGTPVKVGLGRLEGSLLFRAPERLLLDGKPAEKTSFRYQGGPLTARGEPYLEVLQTRKNGTYSWRAYRGRLEVDQAGGMINVLDFEHYLAGVVPSEVPSYYPSEALKTMAVVARTFGSKHLGRHQTFDVCTEVHCQVYRGLAQEAESTNQAIAATSQERLTFEGRPADTTFHAVCGGMGADVWRVWTGSPQVPYLVGRPDLVKEGPGSLSEEKALRAFLDDSPEAYCQGSGRYRWTRSYTREELRKTLEESLPSTSGVDYRGLPELKSVQVVARTPGGRVDQLVIEGGGERYSVRGDAIRWLFSGGRIGTAGLQSTLFYVAEQEDTFEFRGGGWGHGVGLCQQGAAGRAERGQTYREIIEHYYPGTELVVPR